MLQNRCNSMPRSEHCPAATNSVFLPVQPHRPAHVPRYHDERCSFRAATPQRACPRHPCQVSSNHPTIRPLSLSPGGLPRHTGQVVAVPQSGAG